MARGKMSGWDRYDRVMRRGGLEVVVLFVSVTAVAFGLLALRASANEARAWRDRPQVTTEATREEIMSRTARGSESGHWFWGRYRWDHQRSSGTFDSDVEYEYKAQVPETVSVGLYLGADDEWHLMGAQGDGALAGGLVSVGCVVLIVGGALTGLIMVRQLLGKWGEARSDRAGAQPEGAEGGGARHDDPIVAFARRACRGFLKEFDKASFRCGARLARGLGLAPDDEVLLAHDDTFTKSGKEGFAITTRGFSCRETGERQAVTTTWADLAAAGDVRKDGCYVRVGQVPLVYYTDSDERGCFGRLFGLCKQLQERARDLA